MEICWKDDFFRIRLHWSLPRLFGEYKEEQLKVDDAFIYSISCQWSEADDRLLYLGMTYKQDVWSRMNQHGLKKCREQYPRKSKKLIVSVATLEETDGNITENLVKDVEALLIYSAWNSSMVNTRSINGYTGRSKRQILVENYGYTLLPKKVFWGVSSSK